MSENEPAQMIEGRYRIVRNIAEGGMATVYEAIDERLGRTVAIKVMHTQLAKGPHREQFVERFRREANSAASIANPHIVQVYDTGEFNGLDFLVMEYVHGVNLRHEKAHSPYVRRCAWSRRRWMVWLPHIAPAWFTVTSSPRTF